MHLQFSYMITLSLQVEKIKGLVNLFLIFRTKTKYIEKKVSL